MSIMKNAFEVSCTIGDLLFGDVSVISGHELYFERAKGFPIDLTMFLELSSHVRFLGVTQYFMDVVDYFHSPNGETPAGFRAEYEWKGNGTLLVDLMEMSRNVQSGNTQNLKSSVAPVRLPAAPASTPGTSQAVAQAGCVYRP